MEDRINLRTYGYDESNTYESAYEGKYAPMANPVKDPEIKFMNMFRHECGNKTSMGLESKDYTQTGNGVPTNGEGTMPKAEWYEVNEFPIKSEE